MINGEQVKAHTLSIIRSAIEAQDEIERGSYQGALFALEAIGNDCARLQRHCGERIEAIMEGREE